MMMKKIIAIIMLFVVLPVYGQEIALGVGTFYTDPSMIVVIKQPVKAVNIVAASWTGPESNIALGLSKAFNYKRCFVELGGWYIRDKTERIGTHGNFLVGAGCYIRKNKYIEILHGSNGDAFFDNQNNYGRTGDNAGVDFITFGVKY